MDNRIGSQIKRGLKVSGDYLIALIIFGVFSSLVLSLFKENVELGINIFSGLIFLIMFLMIYSNMRDMAFKEKRPQYGINPPPYKGFLYGFIGIVPIFIIQLLYYVISLPEEVLTLKRRVIQALTGPLYWLAKIISHEIWAYHLVLLIVPVIAGLGYMAGYHGLYIMKKLKIFNKQNKNQKTPLRK